MLELLRDPDNWLSLLTLTILEVVLGIDNIIFITVLVDRLPPVDRERGRRLGLMGALVTRLALLTTLSMLAHLTRPLLHVFGRPLSGRSLILLGGGLFLLFKATREIFEKLEGEGRTPEVPRARGHAFGAVIAQIMVVDLVFSLDSVITAVGMSQELAVMVAANLIALGVMLWAGRAVGDFVEAHPSVKMLALSFLIMIGFMLTADGAGFHIPKAYAYVAMGFSVAVEMINIRLYRRGAPVQLRGPSLMPPPPPTPSPSPPPAPKPAEPARSDAPTEDPKTPP